MELNIDVYILNRRSNQNVNTCFHSSRAAEEK